MINTGQVASFIDDMLVETKSEKGYDELVEEILTRMKETDFLCEAREV